MAPASIKTNWAALRPFAVAAALAASAVAPAAAETFTRVGQSATWNSSTGTYSFTLSLAANPLGAGSYAFAMPSAVSLPSGNMIYDTDTHSGPLTLNYHFATQAGIANAGIGYVKSGSLISAPGVDYPDRAIYAFNGGGRVNFYNSSDQFVPQKSFSALWGSIENGNEIMVQSTRSGSLVTSYIFGSNILAAASQLGIPGGIDGSKSFYVTVNSLLTGAGDGIRAFSAITSSGTMQLAPLSFSARTVTPNVVLDLSAATTPGDLSGAPAPVAGSTPLASTVAFGLLGMLGIRRRAAA